MSDAGPHGGDLAVEAHGLVKTFGDQRAVDAIDLAVHRGEVFGVLGPNGAGKTTMLKMLATLLPIDAGEASIFGVDVRRNPHVVRQLLGVTGQYASVDELLTATENLVLFGRLQGLGRGESRATGGAVARAVRPHRGRAQADQAVLRRHAATPGPGREPDHPAAADLPRRADHRPRPAHPRPDVGDHPRAGPRRQHRAADHAVPRRGRPARRPDRGDRPWTQGRPGHARRAEVLHRPLVAPGCSSSTPSTWTAPAPSCSGCWTSSRADPRGPAPHRRPLPQRPGGRRAARPCARPASASSPWRWPKPSLDEVFLALTGHDTHEHDRRARRRRPEMETIR